MPTASRVEHAPWRVHLTHATGDILVPSRSEACGMRKSILVSSRRASTRTLSETRNPCSAVDLVVNDERRRERAHRRGNCPGLRQITGDSNAPGMLVKIRAHHLPKSRTLYKVTDGRVPADDPLPCHATNAAATLSVETPTATISRWCRNKSRRSSPGSHSVPRLFLWVMR